jgi:quinoprotein glucose dehydrogenase
MSLRPIVIAAAACAVTIVAGAAQLPAPVEATRGEWRHYGGDAASTKYSPLDQITGENVGSLRIAWRWTSPDNAIAQGDVLARPGGFQDTPLMIGGVLYTTTSLGIYAALDPATGRTLWQYDPGIWKRGVRPPNMGFTHRGSAYWTDGRARRLLSGTHDAHLLSLDAETGQPDPLFGTGGQVDVLDGVAYAERTRNYAINSAPVVVRDVVIAGANIQDLPPTREQARGDISGFDVRTGRKLWTFHAIPQRGEFGYETWEDGSAEYSGGTNVWSLITVDEELGYVYLPFGTPTNDYYGGHRLGDNLFAESLVCLDARTGRRVWHFQAVHHGLWDYDFPAAPILVDLTVEGRRIPAVAQVSKQGFVYVFDRRTGEPVWPIEERPVPASTVPGERASRTQPFPTKPPPFDRQSMLDDDVIDFTPALRAQALEVLQAWNRGTLFTPPSERGTVHMPGGLGGADWGGAGVDPETGWLYVPSFTNPVIVQLVKGDPAVSNLQYRRGGTLALPTLDSLPLYKPPYSRVTAYDLNTGTIVWQVPIGDGPRRHPMLASLNLGPLGSALRAAPLVTRTLLFVSQYSGAIRRGENLAVAGREFSRIPEEPPTFRAFDKKTGTLVWEFVLPLGPSAAPMTYMYGGKQYIVIAAGTGAQAELIAFALP